MDSRPHAPCVILPVAFNAPRLVFAFVARRAHQRAAIALYHWDDHVLDLSSLFKELVEVLEVSPRAPLSHVHGLQVGRAIEVLVVAGNACAVLALRCAAARAFYGVTAAVRVTCCAVSAASSRHWRALWRTWAFRCMRERIAIDSCRPGAVFLLLRGAARLSLRCAMRARALVGLLALPRVVVVHTHARAPASVLRRRCILHTTPSLPPSLCCATLGAISGVSHFTVVGRAWTALTFFGTRRCGGSTSMECSVWTCIGALPRCLRRPCSARGALPAATWRAAA